LFLSIASLLLFAPAPARDEFTVPSGEVYAYGHYLAAPYHLTVARDTLWINGFPVLPGPERDRPPAPAAALDVARHDLHARAVELSRRLRDGGEPLDSITRTVAAMYAADTAIVGSVTRLEPGRLQVQWRGRGFLEEVSIAAEPTPIAPRAVRIRDEMHDLERLLDRGCLVILGAGGRERVIVPPERRDAIDAVRREIDAARSAGPSGPDPVTWAGRHLSVRLAQEFAAPPELPIPKGRR
jgi:hypothetical protein